MTIQSYRDLEVWKLGMELAEQCYLVTKSFPKEEMFGLTSQIRRAVASIPANIAEGHARETTGEYRNQLSVARGSLSELETHLLLSQRLGLLPENQATVTLESCERLSRMLVRLQQALRNKQARG